MEIQANPGWVREDVEEDLSKEQCRDNRGEMEGDKGEKNMTDDKKVQRLEKEGDTRGSESGGGRKIEMEVGGMEGPQGGQMGRNTWQDDIEGSKRRETNIVRDQGVDQLEGQERGQGNISGEGALRVKKGGKSWKRRVREGNIVGSGTFRVADVEPGGNKRELKVDKEREEEYNDGGSPKRRKGECEGSVVKLMVGAEIVPQPHQMG